MLTVPELTSAKLVMSTEGEQFRAMLEVIILTIVTIVYLSCSGISRSCTAFKSACVCSNLFFQRKEGDGGASGDRGYSGAVRAEW